jgi:hypothetical protein
MTSSKTIQKNSRQANKRLRTCVRSNIVSNKYYSVDYLNRTYNVLSDDPARSDSMMFTKASFSQKDSLG